MEDNDYKKKSDESVNLSELSSLNFAPDWEHSAKSDSSKTSSRFKRRAKRSAQSARRSSKKRSSKRRRQPSRRPKQKRKKSASRNPKKKPALPIEIRFIPEQARLRILVGKLHETKRAHPLLALAKKFVSKPQFYRVIIQHKKGAKNPFWQCKKCSFPASDRESLEQHCLEEHFDDYFEVKELEAEPVKGNFVCLAKCGLSGRILAPPNHHTYKRKLKEAHLSVCPHMPAEKYRSKVKLIHDEAEIEKWKAEEEKRFVCSLKSDSEENGTEEISRSEAQARFKRDFMAELIKKNHRVVFPGSLISKLTNADLKSEVMRALRKERRFPLNLIIALQAAFKHMKLYLFKIDKKRTFVTSIRPDKFKDDNLSDEIKAILDFIEKNLGCTRNDVIAELEKESGNPLTTQLAWLLEKGHIIELNDGKLLLPKS